MALSHKHLKLDQATIDRALDLVIAEAAILRSNRKVKRSAGVVDIFRGP